MKYALAGLLTIPFLVATAWLVRSEGESFRRSARAARDGQVWVRAVEEPGRGAVDLARVPATTGPDVAKAGTEPEPLVPPRPVPPGPTLPTGDLVPEPAPPPPPLPAPVAPSIPPVAPPNQPVPHPADQYPVLTFDIDKDAASLTPEQERSLGRAIHEAILQRHRTTDPGTMQRRLIDAARPILVGRQRKEIDYTFTVLDSDDVYAFSHPGGYIYVTRGIFSLVADEAELQFLLGHEIAHVDLKHDAKLVSEATLVDNAAGRLGISLAQRFYHQIAQGHTDDQEYQADAWSFRQMIRLEQSPYQARRFLRKYLDYVERLGIGAGRQPPSAVLDAGLQDVGNHWRSHPPALERLERLRALKGGS